MIYRSEVEIATGLKTQLPRCYYCGGRFCPGFGCPEQVEASILEERRQRKQEEIWDALDALAIEKREHELIHKLRLEEEARVAQEIELCRAEYESNQALLDRERERELADALSHEEESR